MSIRALDTIRITVHGAAFDQAVKNVLYYAVDADLTGDDTTNLEAILGDFRTRWRSAVLPQLAEAYAVLAYQAAVIQGSLIETPDDRPPYKALSVSGVAELAGTVADSPTTAFGALPLHATMTVQKRTNMSGRGKRGSLRLSPITVNHIMIEDPNSLKPEAVTAAAPVETFLKTPLTIIGHPGAFEPVLLAVSRLIEAAPQNSTNAFRTLITSGRVNTNVGSQVSRKTRQSLGA